MTKDFDSGISYEIIKKVEGLVDEADAWLMNTGPVVCGTSHMINDNKKQHWNLSICEL